MTYLEHEYRIPQIQISFYWTEPPPSTLAACNLLKEVFFSSVVHDLSIVSRMSCPSLPVISHLSSLISRLSSLLSHLRSCVPSFAITAAEAPPSEHDASFVEEWGNGSSVTHLGEALT